MRGRRWVALSAAVAIIAATVTPASAVVGPESPSTPDRIAVEGVVVQLADSQTTQAYVVTEDSTAIALTGDEAAGLPPGAAVELTVMAPQGVTEVEDFADSTEPVEVASVTSVDPVPEVAAGISSQKTRYLDIAVNLNSRVPQPSEAQISALVADVSDYWRANTSNEMGPLQIRHFTTYRSALPCDADNPYAWAEEAAGRFGRTAAQYSTATSSANPAHLVVFGECNNDGSLGVATLGVGIDSGGWTNLQESLFDATNGPLGYATSTLAHELGHNLGLGHANVIDHEECDFSQTPAYGELEWCPTAEYEDTATIMGYATEGQYSLPLLDMASRDHLGVTTGLIAIDVAGSHAHDLAPVGSASGTRGLRIYTGASGKTYYLEYRTNTQEPDSYDTAHGATKVLRVLEYDGDTTLKTSRGDLLPDDDVNRGLGEGEQWQSDAGDLVITVGSTTDAGAQVTVDLDEATAVTLDAPTLTSLPVPGSPVTAEPAVASPESATVTYQWFVDNDPVPDATGLTYTPTEADRGKSVRVLATGAGGATKRAQAASGRAEGFVRTSVPLVVGTAKVGRTLTAVPSEHIPPDAELAYAWLRSGVPIGGASDVTYTVTASDVGHTLAVTVSATTTEGVIHETTAETQTVPHGQFVADVAPHITGTNRPGATLRIVTGTFYPAPTTVLYRWWREDDLIAGANGPTYVISARDYGSLITAEVMPVREGFEEAWWWTGEWIDVVGGSLNVTAPSLPTSVKVGASVKPSVGVWAYHTTLKYQWLRNGAAISGATKSTYTPTSSDRGKKLSLRVTGQHPWVGSLTKTTASRTVAYGTLKTVKPTISGTTRTGRTLTAWVGAWTSGTSFSYQWYANGKAIRGATKKTFKLTGSQVNKTITVRVVGKKSGYTTASRTSSATAKVRR